MNMENMVDVKSQERPTQVLTAEHRIIERALAVLEKLTGAPVKASVEDWKKTLEFIRHFADRCHHSKEEKFLFPAIEGHGISRENGPIGTMLLEHEEGRRYVRSMMAALDLCGTNNEAAEKTLVENAKAYSRLVRAHIEDEGKVLFRIADAVLPADEQKELLRTFEEHEAEELGEGIHEKYLSLLEELEASNS
jgi:hemerythrin-like domain-containing protein